MVFPKLYFVSALFGSVLFLKLREGMHDIFGGRPAGWFAPYNTYRLLAHLTTDVRHP